MPEKSSERFLRHVEDNYRINSKVHKEIVRKDSKWVAVEIFKKKNYYRYSQRNCKEIHKKYTESIVEVILILISWKLESAKDLFQSSCRASKSSFLKKFLAKAQRNFPKEFSMKLQKKTAHILKKCLRNFRLLFLIFWPILFRWSHCET